jgi:hypothetical protein
MHLITLETAQAIVAYCDEHPEEGDESVSHPERLHYDAAVAAAATSDEDRLAMLPTRQEYEQAMVDRRVREERQRAEDYRWEAQTMRASLTASQANLATSQTDLNRVRRHLSSCQTELTQSQTDLAAARNRLSGWEEQRKQMQRRIDLLTKKHRAAAIYSGGKGKGGGSRGKGKGKARAAPSRRVPPEDSSDEEGPAAPTQESEPPAAAPAARPWTVEVRLESLADIERMCKALAAHEVEKNPDNGHAAVAHRIKDRWGAFCRRQTSIGDLAAVNRSVSKRVSDVFGPTEEGVFEALTAAAAASGEASTSAAAAASSAAASASAAAATRKRKAPSNLTKREKRLAWERKRKYAARRPLFEVPPSEPMAGRAHGRPAAQPVFAAPPVRTAADAAVVDLTGGDGSDSDSSDSEDEDEQPEPQPEPRQQPHILAEESEDEEVDVVAEEEVAMEVVPDSQEPVEQQEQPEQPEVEPLTVANLQCQDRDEMFNHFLGFIDMAVGALAEGVPSQLNQYMENFTSTMNIMELRHAYPMSFGTVMTALYLDVSILLNATGMMTWNHMNAYSEAWQHATENYNPQE